MQEPLFALIIAGGVGARFWPRSRQANPKQCLEVGDGESLLQRTVARLAPLVPPERVLVVTGAQMADRIREQLPQLAPENILVEPTGRNTAPAVGWGAMVIAKRAKGSDPVVAVLPADHLIEDEVELRSLLRDCAMAARSTGALVTLGLTPTRPETGFGYLHVGGPLGEWGGHTFLRVRRFVEKPELETAQAYVEGGEHLWNAGMFVFSVESLRDAFRRHLPNTWANLERLLHSPERLVELYPALEKVSFDVGIMEKAAHVLTLRAELGWSDLGSWEAMAQVLPKISGGHGIGHVIAVDSNDNVVHAPGKVVALLGVSGLVVVDTGDALLICPRSQAQRVRELHALLREEGLEQLL